MSKTEDYLDGLLSSMEGKKPNNIEPELPTEESGVMGAQDFAGALGEVVTANTSGRDADQDFLDSFEREFLSGEDEDEFIRQFERELAAEEGRVAAGSDADDLFLDNIDDLDDLDDLDNLDTIVNNSQQETVSEMSTSLFEEEAEMDFMVDTLGDLPGNDIDASMNTADENDFSFSGDLDESLPELEDAALTSEEVSDELIDDDQDLMDLLQSDGDFSGLGDMLGGEEERTILSGDLTGEFDGFTLEEVPIDDTMVLEEAEEPSVSEEKTKGEASGFLNKISKVLFGEDEDELPETPAPAPKPVATASVNMDDLSDDNLLLLQELEGVGETPAAEEEKEVQETEEEAKARKKREKAEKKAQKKAEKAEKKAQKKAEKEAKKAQKEKEKKPKKPKEPDNTPPLPKKPVILSFVMAGSFLVLVILGTNLFGYSSSMQNAEKQFGLGNYEAAYQEVAGLEIKEKDYEAYGKYRVMGTVAGEYTAYQTFMEAGLYDMALDALVRAVGRCEKYQAEAELYGCVGELTKIREQASGALGSFGITQERALELYEVEERTDYSVQINTILTEAGYTVID